MNLCKYTNKTTTSPHKHVPHHTDILGFFRLRCLNFCWNWQSSHIDRTLTKKKPPSFFWIGTITLTGSVYPKVSHKIPPMSFGSAPKITSVQNCPGYNQRWEICDHDTYNVLLERPRWVKFHQQQAYRKLKKCWWLNSWQGLSPLPDLCCRKYSLLS